MVVAAIFTPRLGVDAHTRQRLVMVLTVLEAVVAEDRTADLVAAYRSAGTKLPPGLLHTDLLRASDASGRWRIQSYWANRGALDAMRAAGTPAGVLMFRAAGAEPALSVFEVAASLGTNLER
jgi:quinol monooxygenase YgiN